MSLVQRLAMSTCVWACATIDLIFYVVLFVSFAAVRLTYAAARR
jgi:hypothetical protein